MNKTEWTTTGLALGCLLALGAAAAPEASAQTPIRSGQTVRGSLSSSDPKADDDSYYDLYTYRGRRGETLSIRLASGAFDAFVSLGRLNGGQFEQIESDDDGGGGTDALLEVTLPADGEYTIRANSLMEGETGDYTITVSSGSAPQKPEPNPGPNPGPNRGTVRMESIRPGQTVSGSLSTSDPRLETDNTFYDLWRFSGRRGQRFEAVMTSTAFDAYLAIGRMEGGVLNVEKSDDDGAGGSNPRILITLAQDGEYVIRANSLNEGETGAYTLRLTQMAALPPAPAPRAIRSGQAVTGTLAEGDPMADDDSFYDAYVYTARAGERLTITMASDAFDTYLVIGRMVAGQFEPIESNDDAPGESDGTNSRLEITLPQAGQYVIRANSLSSESTGQYTLRVVSGR